MLFYFTYILHRHFVLSNELYLLGMLVLLSVQACFSSVSKTGKTAGKISG